MTCKIYIDMDGVLADFDKAVSLIEEIQPLTHFELRSEEEDDRMWARLSEIPHFYLTLDPMPGSIEMFNTIREKYGEHVEILTGIPKPKHGIITAAEDKIEWARRYLGDVKVNIVFTGEKLKYCKGPGCVLIDDFHFNIDPWIRNGGTGIIHKSPEETLKALNSIGF